MLRPTISIRTQRNLLRYGIWHEYVGLCVKLVQIPESINLVRLCKILCVCVYVYVFESSVLW